MRKFVALTFGFALGVLLVQPAHAGLIRSTYKHAIVPAAKETAKISKGTARHGRQVLSFAKRVIW